jgi:hypothetical protein
MGIDLRRGWTARRCRPITANVDALLAENEALGLEVRALRQQLERLPGQAVQRVSASPNPGIRAALVDRWCQAMACHPAWSSLRVGPPAARSAADHLKDSHTSPMQAPTVHSPSVARLPSAQAPGLELLWPPGLASGQQGDLVVQAASPKPSFFLVHPQADETPQPPR